MYRILSDGYTVYDPRLPDNTILSGKLNLEVNKAGSLEFTIPESNPHYGMIALMKSIVTVYDDDKLIFRGRPCAPSRNLYRDNEIVCEGELAFFNDTYQEPFEFYGTVTDLFTQVITAHNSQVSAEKQFKVGTINVTNDTESGKITRSDIEYMTTWDFLREKFFESELGGYLWVRHEDDGAYIDYLSDLNFIGKQSVTQCINLADVTEEITTDDLATVVVPLGAKIKDEDGNDTDEYLTVSGVNNGKIYIEDAEGISEYGRIVIIVKHDDITDASNLLRAGQADLGAAMGVATTVTITAADLARAGYDVDSFCFGTYVDVNIANLGISDRMLIKKLSIDLLAPESNTITVGQTVRSFTAGSVHTSQTIGKMESNVSAGLRGNKQEIALIRGEVNGVREDLDNLRIGGRNLLIGTKDMSGFDIYDNITETEIKTGEDGFGYVDFPVYELEGSGASYNRWITSNINALPIEAVWGKDVVISFEYRSTDNSGDRFCLELALCNSESTGRIRYHLKYEYPDMTPEWQRYEYKVHIDESLFTGSQSGTSGLFEDCTRFWVRIYAMTGQQICYRKVQLELGNIATDWSPCPDDMATTGEVTEVIREVSTQINQTEENIISTVTEEYYSKSDTDDLLASMSTEFEQTSSGFEMRFEEFQQNLDNLDSDTFAEFNEWKKYIRFENGNIILGEAGNELILRIENNKITFLENGAEIAYWQNRKFYAVDGEFINSLRLGKFAFLPRPNGNLSFKKVVD